MGQNKPTSRPCKSVTWSILSHHQGVSGMFLLRYWIYACMYVHTPYVYVCVCLFFQVKKVNLIPIFIQALVEKDWLAFGHPFSDRAGMPSFSGSDIELPRQSSSSNFSSSPMRQTPGSFPSQSPMSSQAHTSNNYSPIFLQVGLSNLFSGLTEM